MLFRRQRTGRVFLHLITLLTDIRSHYREGVIGSQRVN